MDRTFKVSTFDETDKTILWQWVKAWLLNLRVWHGLQKRCCKGTLEASSSAPMMMTTTTSTTMPQQWFFLSRLSLILHDWTSIQTRSKLGNFRRYSRTNVVKLDCTYLQTWQDYIPEVWHGSLVSSSVVRIWRYFVTLAKKWSLWKKSRKYYKFGKILNLLWQFIHALG